MKKILIFLFFSFFILHFSFSYDFGLLFKGEFELIGRDKTSTESSVILAPWLSVPFNNAFTNAELYASAGINMGITADSTGSDVIFAPELYRLEYFSRPSTVFTFRLGRIIWQDVSRFIVRGRFDGAEFLFDLGNIQLGASALYTGFLFKDTAYINISPGDPADYSVSFNWADFSGSYCAPRRLLASVYGEFPACL